MDFWWQIVVGVIVFAITAPIGFFAGREFEKRWDPIVWTLEQSGPAKGSDIFRPPPRDRSGTTTR